MSTMSELPGYALGPEARVAVLRRHDGYAVAVVLHEGPFDHETAQRMAASERQQRSGKLTKAQAAAKLGIGVKGVDYLRSQGLLVSEREPSGRVLITSDSVDAELQRRNGE